MHHMRDHYSDSTIAVHAIVALETARVGAMVQGNPSLLCRVRRVRAALFRRLGWRAAVDGEITAVHATVASIAAGMPSMALRLGHPDQNLAVLCRLALNLPRRESTAKVGIKAKCFTAWWNHAFLAKSWVAKMRLP